MKKNLAVRVGAVVMVLLVALFTILPDIVNAEGENQEPSTEVAVNAPNTETSSNEEQPSEPVQEETPSDKEQPSEPGLTEPSSSEEQSSESVQEETPSSETTGTDETLTEQPSAGETEENQTEQQNNVQPQEDTGVPETEAASSEEPATPTDEPKKENFERPKNTVATRTVTVFGEETLSVSDESEDRDFIIEGTTVTGYVGPGGYIAIPDGITAIADNAFYGNQTITGVLFPGTLQTIGSSAFNGCSNLETLTIPDSVTTIGVSAFANCTGLASVSISASAGAIVQGEFYNCISLTSVAVPEGISSIASQAFGSCGNLSSISVPASAVSIDSDAFGGDVNLTSITVASGNGIYTSYDGCLYTAGGSQLTLCPQGKTSISFASGMTSVARGAFSGCSYLLSATIPSATSTIESDAFSGSGIQSVTIPAEVTSIGTQSGWAPSIVYGYSGSVAETWADENNYVFERLDTPDDGNGGDGGKKPGGSNGNGGQKSDGNPNDRQPSISGTNTTTVSAAGAGTTVATVATMNQHVKDSTPKTGVEDYAIYFLFGAILMVGVACFVYSKKLRYDGQSK